MFAYFFLQGGKKTPKKKKGCPQVGYGGLGGGKNPFPPNFKCYPKGKNLFFLKGEKKTIFLFGFSNGLLGGPIVIF